MSDIAKKIIDIQSRLKAPKNQTNTFSKNKYKFRSCEDILEAVKPLLKENEIFINLNDEIIQIGERYYIKATAQISDGENTIQSSAFARETENKTGFDASQITGACSSYARKYALNGLFAIDDTKDADYNNNDAETTKQETKQETKEEPIYRCISCGKIFKPFKSQTNGQLYTPKQIYNCSIEKNGRPLCKQCAEKLKNSEAQNELYR